MARNEKVLVSMLSEQTIPNVELIQEFKSEINKYVFITTKQMEKQFDWIINTTKILKYEKIQVEAFDIVDIEEKIRSYPFGDDEIILNVTGGTKLMLLTVYETFKNLGATIYYITGQNKNYVKVFPGRGKRNFVLNEKLSLSEYLTAYGFNFNVSKPHRDIEMSKSIFKFYTSNDSEILLNIFEPIRLRRGKTMKVEDSPNIAKFLDRIKYPYENILTKKDVKYLSGEWFEEFIYFKIKEELKLQNDEIETGLKLKKEGSENEIDVIFIYKHKLYIIECKTSIIERRILRQGEEVEKLKDKKLLPEIIYKSDALRNKLGLFANTSIFTLEEIKNNDGSPIQGYESHFKRAELSRIKIVSRRDLINKNLSIKKLLKIN